MPHEWTAKFSRPYDYCEMDDFDKKMLELRMIDYNKVQSGFRFEQPKIVSFILNNCTESSIKSCKNEYKSDFKKLLTTTISLVISIRCRLTHFGGKPPAWRRSKMQSQRPLTLGRSYPKYHRSSSCDGIIWSIRSSGTWESPSKNSMRSRGCVHFSEHSVPMDIP